MPLDCAPPISWGPLAGPASTTRCLPGICPLPDTVPNVSTPWDPFLSPLPASCIPDAHQPWSSPCSTAEGTLPLPTSVQPGSLKPPSPHPKAGGGALRGGGGGRELTKTDGREAKGRDMLAGSHKSDTQTHRHTHGARSCQHKR